jgi:hypothetical protein
MPERRIQSYVRDVPSARQREGERNIEFKELLFESAILRCESIVISAGSRRMARRRIFLKGLGQNFSK